MKVVGFSGQIGVGKNEAANYLAKKLGWKAIGFADALKQLFMNYFNVSWEFIEEWKRKNEIPPGFDLNIRKSLQLIGNEFRNIKETVWTDIVFNNNDSICIYDCRYLQEAREIKERGGVNILLYRPNFVNNDSAPSESQLKPIINWCIKNCLEDGPITHYKHCPNCDQWLNELTYYDFFLKNDDTLETLCNKIDNILIPFLSKKGLL